MNLGLQNEISILYVEIFGYIEGFIGSDSSVPALDKDIVLTHKGLTLILMEIEVAFDIVGEGSVESGGYKLGDHTYDIQYKSTHKYN